MYRRIQKAVRHMESSVSHTMRLPVFHTQYSRISSGVRVRMWSGS